jgi:hypothetical protein
MKTLRLFPLILLAFTIFAQQPGREGVPLPPDQQAQAAELMQKLYKLRGNYAEAISLYHEYLQKRDDLMTQFRTVTIAGGKAAHLTDEQIASSSLIVDDKGVCRWIAKANAQPSEPLPRFEVNEEPETSEVSVSTYTVRETDGYKNLVHAQPKAVNETLPQFRSGWFYDVTNRTPSPVTITASATTINGAGTFTLMPGKSIRVVSDGKGYRTVDFNGRN